MVEPALRNQPEATGADAALVSKAVARAAADLGLSGAALGRVIGVSASTVTRLHQGAALTPDAKPFELALLVLRLYRSLDALVGGNSEQARAWLHSRNRDLDATPAQLIESAGGLVHVVDYLDAMRGQ